MSNVAGKQDDVTNAADKLMKRLLNKADDPEADLDFSVQVMQTATRYLAVKGRINVPDEGNAFDGFREQLGEGSSGERGARRPAPAAATDDRGVDLPAPGEPARAGPPTPRSSGVRKARSAEIPPSRAPDGDFLPGFDVAALQRIRKDGDGLY